ncbi:MAG TPA: hypothetical protein V6D20_18055, partial [Candidatus Obscuribacterales bacterium]
FKEFNRPDVKFKPIYTIPQVKQMFLESRDPSEYSAAMSIVGDWDHWLMLRNHPNLKGHVDKWLEEMAVKLRSEAIKQMVAHSKAQGGTAAAKWLADKGYADVLGKRGAGRPKKEEEEKDHSHVEEKLATVLSIVNGVK